MWALLLQPYPLPESRRQAVGVSLGAGVFVGAFLLIFQPFGADDWQSPYKVPALAGYGAVTTLTMLFNYFVLPRLWPGPFREARWTVGKEILSTGWTFLSIGLGNYAYNHVLFGTTPHLGGLLGMIGATFLVGIFPATGITLLNYIQRLRRYGAPPQPVPATPEEQRRDQMLTVELVAENERDRLVVPASDLFYIESTDNYATVVFRRQDGQLCRQLLRGSLSRLEGQIGPDFVVRCHRSFIVNLHRVQSVSGNAQGYKLHLDAFGLVVPVARRFTEPVVGRWRGQG
jgi:hypothetical protein